MLGFIKSGYACRGCGNTYLDKDGGVHLINRDKCMGCNGFEGVTRRVYGFVDGKGVKHDGDGCIVKVKGERKSVVGTLWYQLSHCSLRRGVKRQNVVTWFGLCGRRKLKVPKSVFCKVEHRCKICGEPHYAINFHGDYRELLRVFSGLKFSDSVIFDYRDKDGKVMWSVKPVKTREVYCDG